LNLSSSELKEITRVRQRDSHPVRSSLMLAGPLMVLLVIVIWTRPYMLTEYYFWYSVVVLLGFWTSALLDLPGSRRRADRLIVTLANHSPEVLKAEAGRGDEDV